MPEVDFSFDKMVASVTKVTLGGGVVGRISHLLMVAVFGLTAVAWKAADIWLSSAVVAVIAVVVPLFCWLLIRFADRRPEAAFLEGAEFIAHERLTHASKSNPQITIDSGDRIPDPESPPPALPSPESQEPDRPPGLREVEK
jgi:hypothetical protein